MSRLLIHVIAVMFGLGMSDSFAQGLALNGVGPVNQSMGGAGVAAPLDVVGAIHWNPAALSGLQQPEVAFGATLALTSQQVTSEIEFPFALSGSTRGEPGASPIPYAALAYRDADSAITYGIGILGVGGFRSNYPASQSNPVLTPQPPLGVGVGAIASEAEILQFVPTVSYAVTESLAIGFAPTISMARINADPLLLAAPDDADGDGNFTYPYGRGSRHHWGGGFQLGAYHIRDDWHYGVSFKSPQWFESFRFKTADELGRPQTVSLNLEYPTIVSIGTAYSGVEDLVMAVDLRYLTYQEAAGLGNSGFRPDGSVAGLGWESIFALAAGVQARLTESTYIRFGYAFNENPIPNSQTSVNVGSPVILQHFFNVGASVHVREGWILSMAYTHGFENSIEGPIQTPLGALPGSSVRSDVSLNGLTVGFTMRR